MIAILYEGDPASVPAASRALGGDVSLVVNGSPDDLIETGARVWMAGGAPALKAFRAAGLLPPGKIRKLEWYRGQAFPHPARPDARVMVTVTPDSARYDPRMFYDVARDVGIARRLLRTGRVDPEVGWYEWVDDLDGVREYVEGLLSRGETPEPAVDLETEGLNPFDPVARILTVSVTAAPGISDVVDVRDADPDRLKRVRGVLEWLLTDPRIRVRGANFKFDMLWLRCKWGITCENLFFDTCTAGSLLDENRANTLSNHTFDYAPRLGGYDLMLEREYDKSRIAEVPPEDLLTYAGGDTDACYRVADEQRRQLLETSRSPRGGVLKRSPANLYVHVVRPAQRLVHEIEHTGLLVDVERFHALGARWAQQIADERHAAAKMLTTSLVKKHGLDYDDDGRPLAPLSKSQLVIDFLFTPAGLNLKPVKVSEKVGRPAVSELHLRMFSDHPEAGSFIECYLRFAKLAKIYSTYYEGFAKYLRPDGRWHATYALHRTGGGEEGPAGTVSGRASASDPAIQTLPSRGDLAKPLRDCVIAPEGYGILSRDYSQGELRVAACWAPEPRMIEAYQGGMDLHVLTPATIRGMSYEEASALKDDDPDEFKALRRTGKVCIAEGSLVLTDSGLKPIEKIATTDLVWDGVEWVSHGGVVYQGEREVIERDGVTGTPDHVVYLEGGDTARLADVPEDGGDRRIARTEADGRPVRLPDGYDESLSEAGGAQVEIRGGGGVWGLRSFARRVRRELAQRVIKGVRVSAGGVEGVVPGERAFTPASGAVLVDPGSVQQPGESVVEELRRARDRVPLRDVLRLRELLPRASSARDLPRRADRQGEQRRALRAGEPQARVATGELGEQARHVLRDVRGALGVRVAPVAPAEAGLPRLRPVAVHDAEAGGGGADARGDIEGQAPRKARVYDILNAGPRNRFTVSGRLVSNCNFGLLYGLRANGLVHYAKALFDMDLTVEEAEELRDKFFETYPGLPDWHEREIWTAHVQSYVESALGRRRHLPLIDSKDYRTAGHSKNMAINFPIQACLGDMMWWAMSLIQREAPWLLPCGQTHDNGLWYYPLDRQDEALEVTAHVMENLPFEEAFGWHPELTFESDAAIGPRLGSMEEL